MIDHAERQIEVEHLEPGMLFVEPSGRVAAVESVLIQLDAAVVHARPGTWTKGTSKTAVARHALVTVQASPELLDKIEAAFVVVLTSGGQPLLSSPALHMAVSRDPGEPDVLWVSFASEPDVMWHIPLRSTEPAPAHVAEELATADEA